MSNTQSSEIWNAEQILKFVLLGNGINPDTHNPVVYGKAIAAIEKLMVRERQEQDEISHAIGFKNGKFAALAKVEPFIDPAYKEAFEELQKQLEEKA